MVLPPDAEQYEKRVVAATDALDAFGSQLIGELDPQDGAFGWWAGYSDWKTLTMLADYLIQSIRGTEDALVSASLAAQVHRQAMYGEQEAMRAAWTEIVKSGASGPEAMAMAISQDKQARRRRNTITASAQACFFHLGQALDRLAAAAIIVGGFQLTESVTSIYWSTLDQYATMLQAGNQKSTVLQPVGTPGRAVQEALVDPVLNWEQFGEPDWLPWMKATRNAVTHRPPGMNMNVTAGRRMTRLFYRQPKWSELQSIVFGTKPPKKLFAAFISTGADDILDGLCDSSVKLVAALVDSMKTCWSARQVDPSIIVQHGGQWPAVEPTQPVFAFEGYGGTLPITGQEMLFNPLDVQRWMAARAMDDRRAEWY